VEIRAKRLRSRAELYDEGDVFLAPSRFEGLGFGLMESQACGMPLITTNAPPMNEYGAARLIECRQETDIHCGKSLTVNYPSVVALANAIRQMNGKDIYEESLQARRNIEDNCDLAYALDRLYASLVSLRSARAA
jgi:glycosyltransferase involved in cell wall biosynthesis